MEMAVDPRNQIASPQIQHGAVLNLFVILKRSLPIRVCAKAPPLPSQNARKLMRSLG